MGGRCAYCGIELSYEDMQVDHVEALRNDGKDDLANMLPACRSCNHYKHTLTVDKFREMVERGPEILARDSVAYRMAVRFGTVKPSPKKVVFFFEKVAQGEGIPKSERVEFG